MGDDRPMSSGMVSRWPVVVALPVDASDLDADGRLTNAAVEHLFAGARAAYFDRCATVDDSRLEIRKSTARARDAAPGDGVTVSVNVVEVLRDSFTMEARLRPADGDGIAATAWCSLSPGAEVSKAMRDEFIALAHAASHIH
jgi:acyl-CoA thioesterase FadM